MIQYSKAIGANTDHKTAQVFFFPKIVPPEQEGQTFFGCIITGEGEDVFTKIRQVGPFLEEQFFSNEQPLSVRIPELLEKLKNELNTIENLSIIFTAVKDEILYVLSTGNHLAFLARNDKLLNLTEGQPREQLISGYLKPDDNLLLINVSTVSKDEGQIDTVLTQRLINLPLDALESEIEAILQKSEDSPPIAAILLNNRLPKKIVPDLTQNIPQIEQSFSSGKLGAVTLEKKKVKISIMPILKFMGKLAIKLLPKSKKSILVTSLAVILFVGVFGGYWIMTKGSRQQAAEEAQSLILARQKLSEAQSFKDSDPPKAQQLLADSKALLNEVLANNSKNEEAEKFKIELEQNSDDILKIYHINDWPVFLSLDLIKDNFKAEKMSYSLQKVLLLDPQEKTLVSVDLTKKTNQILAGSTQLGDAKIASLNGSNAVVYSKDKGILKIDTDTKKLTVVSEPSDEWGEIKDLVGFASNIYVLDNGKNQIWKYVPTQTSYSENIAYIKDGQPVSLVGALRMQIDFSVWILKQGPEIIKLTGGNNDYFGVSGIDTNLQDVTSFFVAEDGDDIYFLEPSNSRLVVLQKNGQYKLQYKGDKFKTAQDFVVDEEAKKIYLLENSVIYQIDLRS